MHLVFAVRVGKSAGAKMMNKQYRLEKETVWERKGSSSITVSICLAGEGKKEIVFKVGWQENSILGHLTFLKLRSLEKNHKNKQTVVQVRSHKT